MPRSELWPAPAKLNLMLRVTGRREDGYHDLQTVFQFLEQSDLLRFRLRDDGQIRCTTPLEGVDEEHNLAVLAARALRERCPSAQGVDIEVHKTLPMGGGLGGGSSNAATTLVVLNRLWNCNLDLHELATIGLQLGADVPVFVHGQAAWAEGVGERLQPLKPLEPWYLVIRPACQVSTAEVFCDSELTRDAEPIKIRDFLAGRDENTCEPLVRARHPAVDEAIEWLDGYTRGRLTGTGSCVFGRFENREQAEAAFSALPGHMSGFVSRGLNRSPLHRKLEQLDGAWPSG
ncbi:MAG: 4-(cytidine 5'-diphospho)-2-C-methyl-D-erythritol kinase [Gammaproteobacteria bacterium]|nr:MAG: 4-(cytidine 5'-diphospho)-2-C-methyl-D-erythritol kinase [Gammaproteobacteria bacterium]